MNEVQFWKRTLLFVVVLIGTLWACSPLHPHIDNVRYSLNGGTEQQGRHPLYLREPHAAIEGSMELHLSKWFEKTWFISSANCIERLVINNREVTDQYMPKCDTTDTGKRMDLSLYLQSGMNNISFHVQSNSNFVGIRLTPARLGPLLFIDLLLALVIATYCFLIRRCFSLFQASRWIHRLFIGGVLLRFFYGQATIASVRSYDLHQHLDYIAHIVNNAALPSLHGGWEYHQAPLYYLLSTCTSTIVLLLGGNEIEIIAMLQAQSLVIGVLFFGVAIWLGTLLFKKHWQQICWTAVLASFPVFVFAGDHISNNSLYLLLAIFSLAYLVLWNKRSTKEYWYWLCIVLGIALLTKSSALAHIAATGCVVLIALYKRTLPLKHALLGAIVIVSIGGLHQHFRENSDGTFRNFGTSHMATDLFVGNAANHYTTFNPLALISQARCDPWRPAPRRELFWEYMFCSAYIGEFKYHPLLTPLVRLMMGLGILILLCSIAGIFFLFRSKERHMFPMLCTTLFVLLAALWYRYTFPYGSNHDMRLSAMLIPCLLFFALHGIDQLSDKHKKHTGMILLLLSAACNTLFLFLLYFLHA